MSGQKPRQFKNFKPITFSLDAQTASFVVDTSSSLCLSGSTLVRGLVMSFLGSKEIESECIQMEDEVPVCRPVAYSLPKSMVDDFRLKLMNIPNATLSNVVRRLLRMYQSNPRIFRQYLVEVGAVL